MSAAELRRAASLMRERAGASAAFAQSQGWWQPDGIRDVFYSADDAMAGVDEDAEHIASWHPAVALAVADWLDEQAGSVIHGFDPDDCPTCRSALTVARAYLGDSP